MAQTRVVRRLPRDARRERILSAARDVFARDGYDRAAMREIAKRAGVTVPVLYDHFPSKAALQVHLLVEEGEELLDLISGPFPATEPRGLFEAVGEAFFAYMEEHRLVWRVLFREAPSDPDVAAVHAELNARATATIARYFESLIADEIYGMKDTAEALAEMAKSAVNGLAAWWWDHPAVPRELVVALASDMLWGGVIGVAGKRR